MDDGKALTGDGDFGLVVRENTFTEVTILQQFGITNLKGCFVSRIVNFTDHIW